MTAMPNGFDGHSPYDLTGRAAVVTGAARGQGRAIAERLCSAGARVVAGDVLDEVLSLSDRDPERIHAVKLDVTDEAQWAATVDAARDRFGPVDILVNNAGVLRRRPLLDETREAFEGIHQVNCVGPFLGMKAVLPHMREAGRGAIVNTLSTAALTGFSYSASYCSSKWALRGLTKVAALELAPLQIRVNAILPGPILTPMILRDDDPGAAERLSKTPLGRAGQPSDIAELALFLVSDAAGFITGGEFVADGGGTAGIVTAAPPTT